MTLRVAGPVGGGEVAVQIDAARVDPGCRAAQKAVRIDQRHHAPLHAVDSGIPIGLPELPQGWGHVLNWARQHPDEIRHAFQQLNEDLTRNGQVVLVVMDALDRMTAQLAQSVECLSGLLQLLLDSRQLKGLRFKVFLREDMTYMPSVLSFPDASKLINEAVYLNWTREDIYALHSHTGAGESQISSFD